MTVGKKVHTTLASAEGIAADLRTFALETDNKQSQAVYAQLASQMDATVNALRAQVSSLEQQEPQYKVFDQMKQGGQSQGQGQSQIQTQGQNIGQAHGQTQGQTKTTTTTTKKF